MVASTGQLYKFSSAASADLLMSYSLLSFWVLCNKKVHSCFLNYICYIYHQKGGEKIKAIGFFESEVSHMQKDVSSVMGLYPDT